MSRSPPPAQQPPSELDDRGPQKIPERARGTSPPITVNSTGDGKGAHTRRGRARFIREMLRASGYRVLRRTDRVPGGMTMHVQKLSTASLHVVECLCDKDQEGQKMLSALSRHPRILKFEETFRADDELFCVSEPLMVLDTVEYAREQVDDQNRESLVQAWMAQIVSAHDFYLRRKLRRDSFSWDAVYLAMDLTVKLGGFRYLAQVHSKSRLPKRIHRSPECLRRECEGEEDEGPIVPTKVWAWNVGATVLEVLLDRSVAGQDFAVPASRISKQKALRNLRRNVPKLPQLLLESGLSHGARTFVESTLETCPSGRWGLDEMMSSEWMTRADDGKCAEWAARNRPWLSGPYGEDLEEDGTESPAVEDPSASEYNLEIVDRMIQAAEMLRDAITALEFTHSRLDQLDDKVKMT